MCYNLSERIIQIGGAMMEISITLTDEQVSDYIQRIEYVPLLTEEEQMIFDAIVEKFQQLQKERKNEENV